MQGCELLVLQHDRYWIFDDDNDIDIKAKEKKKTGDNILAAISSFDISIFDLKNLIYICVDRCWWRAQQNLCALALNMDINVSLF